MSTILLVEDHAVFAQALRRVLHQRGNLEVIAVAESAEQALERLPDPNVDLVLVDVSLPRMSGIGLVFTLHEKYPDLPCVMISGHFSGHYVRRSLNAGARGYLLKDNAEGILEGIRRVLEGDIYVSEELRWADERALS